MKLVFRSIQQKQALAILNWRYPIPYDRYNFDADNIQAELCYLLDDYKFPLPLQRRHYDNIPLTWQ